MSKNEEIDWKKVTNMEEALGEAQKAKAKKAKLFDPKQLVTKAAQIKTMTDSELGVISFGTVVTEELVEINKLATPEEKGVFMLYLALHKAYPDITLEDVKAFSLEDFTKLMKLIFGSQVFFPNQKPSENGLKTPATFRGSGS
jgi:hypothetical protein